MPIKNFNLLSITKRIMLSLPSRFAKEGNFAGNWLPIVKYSKNDVVLFNGKAYESLVDDNQSNAPNQSTGYWSESFLSNVVKFFHSLSDAFKINLDGIDVLMRDTNIYGASGDILDQYMTTIYGVGRMGKGIPLFATTELGERLNTEVPEPIIFQGSSADKPEEDYDYRKRTLSVAYKYGPTKNGLRQIVIDFLHREPFGMYSKGRTGAFFSGETESGTYHSKFFFEDTINSNTELPYSLYGDGLTDPYTAFIELKYKPEDYILEQLCLHLNNAKAFGIKLYLKYPN